MPKSHFQVSACRSIRELAPGARIHVIGVAGVAMAQLAVALAEQGFVVSGSDKDFWEPTGSFLRASAVKLYHGYKRENVPEKVDLVVIGNAISYGHDEVAVVEERNLPYTCFPKLLAETVIEGKHSIVVSGTHGKTTTTALVAWILQSCGAQPGYFIGGVSESLPRSLAIGQGKVSVVEGDEYDSAFFAKVPKFSFYRPDTCIVNAIEYDHADIYPDLEAINREFTSMISAMPAGSRALCCIDFPNVKRLVVEWKKKAACSIITFGEDPEADIRIVSRRADGGVQHVVARSSVLGEISLAVPMTGAYNAKNAVVAYVASVLWGADPKAAATAIAQFQRVKRRQEVRYNRGEITVIEDFAHHPTAVLETLTGIAEGYPGRRLWAVFEPRSNTSRRKVFQQDYINAFRKVSRVTLANVQARAIDSGVELIDVSTLATEISASGVPAECLPDADAIATSVLRDLKPGDLVVVMSNGAFGGLIDKLVAGLGKR